jgi:hypothetical protein
MNADNVFYLPNNSKFKAGSKKKKGILFFGTMLLMFPFALTYICFKQLMCDHEIITVGTTYLKNGVKIKAKACPKCRKIYQGY